MIRILLCLCFAFTSVLPIHAQSPTSTSNDRRLEEQAFALVNQYRAAQGLPLLVWNDRVAELCREHSVNMAKRKVCFGHSGFKSRAATLTSELECSSVGENVAMGKNLSVEQIVHNWINSAEHKRNMEGDYTASAMGVIRDKQGKIYYTQIFIKEKKAE